ncbi:MAG: hypothetical protein QW331_03785 [Candidatus Woesearchaeota archaeon]
MGKAKEKEDDMLFVEIRGPVEVRRNILEATRDVVQHLQRYERFKQVREEKAVEIAKLKTNIKDINRLIGKLRSALPKTKLRIKMHEEVAAVEQRQKELEEKRKKAEKKAKKEEKKVEPEQPKKKELSEIEKLEKELGEIEGRLNKLS